MTFAISHSLVEATDAVPAAEGFVDRHVGTTPADVVTMLARVGVPSLDELIARAVPESIRDDATLALPPAADETQVLAELRAMAARNTVATR